MIDSYIEREVIVLLCFQLEVSADSVGAVSMSHSIKNLKCCDELCLHSQLPEFQIWKDK